MKLQKLICILALMAVALVGSGCNKRLQKTTPLPGYAQTAPGGDERLKPIDPGLNANPNRDTIGNVGLGEKDLTKFQPSAEQPFKGDTVYFDFDKATIKSSETQKLDSIASRMKNLRGKALRIEGHADERGTEEYNRSLGSRRAHSVREYLVRAGLDLQMVDVISYGEDRPAAPGHNEAAYSKNRRAEFVLLDPPH